MAPAKKPLKFSNHLASLSGTLWILFLLLSLLIAPIWALDIGEAQIRETVKARELQTALLWISGSIDLVWLLAATAVVYSSVARSVGLGVARRWGVVLLCGAWLSGALSAWTTWPFGPIHFTSRLGTLLGPVSIGWLLLWFVVILGARDLSLVVSPRASHLRVTMFTAVLAALTSLNIEALASRTRAWWIWTGNSGISRPTTTIQTILAWLIVGGILAWFLRSPILSKPGQARIPQSAQVFLVLHILLVLAHMVGTLRS